MQIASIGHMLETLLKRRKGSRTVFMKIVMRNAFIFI